MSSKERMEAEIAKYDAACEELIETLVKYNLPLSAIQNERARELVTGYQDRVRTVWVGGIKGAIIDGNELVAASMTKGLVRRCRALALPIPKDEPFTGDLSTLIGKTLVVPKDGTLSPLELLALLFKGGRK